MKDRTLVRGLFLIAISLIFGIGSLRYHIGEFSKAGAGLFPLLVSSLLLLLGVITVVRSRFIEREPIDINLKNIALVLTGMCGFVLLSEHLNMMVGIVFMVFCVTFAGTSYSVARNLKISAGLIGVAWLLYELLGLRLPLF
ncbi:MAG TPA: tripartite tricarboxylate transporter TctB family protein [Burkholderiaceae bacterium]|nr:tripartite tricarboxylate transporter TctB family protein [Burkholderiaceae bacterium]